MFFLGVVLTLTFFAVITAAMLGLRRAVIEEEKIEEQLRAPGTHTLDFKVPAGMDPVNLEFALSQAHFTSITRHDGGISRVSIACDEKDRAQVRDVLEHVHAASGAGPDEYLGHVQFGDEIADTSEQQKSDEAPSTTRVAEPLAYDVGKHEKRYLITMGIRTVCFVAAGLSIGHWFVWLFLIGAVVLPYLAVVEAN